jgi:subtilisin
MNRLTKRAARVALCALLVAMLFPVNAIPAESSRRVIVRFSADGASEAKGRLSKAGAEKIGDIEVAHAAVMRLPAGLSMDAVRGMPGVVGIEEDVIVRVAAKPTASRQTLPWGVDRVEADVAWATTTGDPIKVAVIDTGISTGHPDLKANLKGGYSAVAYTSSYNDDNGHGTHVAGTIAAVSNTQGVVGVAHQADLYAVKVLDGSGSGWVSDIAEGILWAVERDVDVINMSLGTPTYSQLLADVCEIAIAEGVTVVSAAGNMGVADPDGDSVTYPAKLPGVIGVSAVDSSGGIASFSSRGDEVDVAAPGVSIHSTYKGKTYATLSGTSMASPHVAGIAALVLTMPVGADDADGDGVWDPAEVQSRIMRTAEDLGDIGWDADYGWGLARADRAVVAR